MSEFLPKILATKQLEVAEMKGSKQFLEETVRTTKARFAELIAAATSLSIVAEIKKASPSKGLIQPNFQPVSTARMYENYGASAISVLTDKTYFQGSIEDLASVHANVKVPVLRKDFIIDEVQIHEAVNAGAEAILLICAALNQDRLRELSQHAKACGLDVLVEVHHADEVEAAMSAEPSVLGINNRDLTTFQVDLAVTEKLIQKIPRGIPVISESGITSAGDAERMAAVGVDGLLVGESLMRQAASDADLRNLFRDLQRQKRDRFKQSDSSEAML